MVSPEESASFIDVLCTAFPEFKIIGERSPNFERTKKSWAVAWTDLTLEECRKVVVQLAIDGHIGYDNYRTPGPFIRKLVIASRNRGKTSEAERAESAIRKATGAYQGSPMAQALAAALKAKAEGKSEVECLAIIDKAIPASAEYDQPTSKCKEHCYQGTLVVWRSDFVQKVIEGKLAIGKLTRAHTYVIACYCGDGIGKNQPKRSKLPVYSTSQFCRYRDDGNDLRRLQAWIDEKRQGKEWAA